MTEINIPDKMENNKRCGKCNIELDRDIHFSPGQKSNHFRQPVCKSCRTEINKLYKRINQPKTIKAKYDKLKATGQTLLGVINAN